MTITASQYLFKASIPTATTTATVGAYTVPAATKGQIVAVTVANTATTNLTTYFDCAIWDGATAYPISGTKTPLYPGGSVIVVGAEKHVLPTGGAIYITPYSTFISVAATIVEVT